MGAAVGDALGRAVHGWKPQTISQRFGRMDDYKDVKPFIGKGVKRFVLRGLYGIQTQCALAACDSLLNNRKYDSAKLSGLLSQLATGASENSFGVFRNAPGIFRKSIERLGERIPGFPGKTETPSFASLSMALPLALFHQEDSPRFREQCLETALLMGCRPLEAAAAVVSGYCVIRLLALEPEASAEFPLSGDTAHEFLEAAAEVCDHALMGYRQRRPELWNLCADDRTFALSSSIRGLKERYEDDAGSIAQWLCQNASRYSREPIHHPTQGQVLSLIPWSLIHLLKGGPDFTSILSRAVEMGKESDKAGAFVGGWAGALYGFSSFPKAWVSGLVNGKEIKARGEALYSRRRPKNLKDLFEMESGLTEKETAEGKRFAPGKAPKKPGGKVAPFQILMGDEEPESDQPSKKDTAQWRRFQKDKTRSKRDRRRNRKEDFDNI